METKLAPSGHTPEQFYESVLRDFPQVAEKGREVVLQAGRYLIENGNGMLDLPATGVNLQKWLESQPPRFTGSKQERFSREIKSIVEDGGYKKQPEAEIIKSVFEYLLEVKGIAPINIKPYLDKMNAKEPKPQTVWDVMCQYNAAFY